MERIEFLMEARLYHAAFAHGKGRLLHNRGINEGEKILQRINIPKISHSIALLQPSNRARRGASFSIAAERLLSSRALAVP